MTYADVHVVPEPGTVEELGALDDVPAVHTVPGEFDPIAQQLASKEDIPDVVGEDIHAKSGVLDTVPRRLHDVSSVDDTAQGIAALQTVLRRS
jgi:hypothetical protein